MKPDRVRRRHRGDNGQAIIETALVLPILLALISVFLGVMVQVEAQQEMDSATKLAAEGFFQAPRLATDAPGTTCCAQSAGQPDSLTTAGMPKGCRFAAESFYGTMSFRRFLVFAADRLSSGQPLCRRGGAAVGAAGNSYITCDIDVLDLALNPPQGLRVVRCSASATLDFARTPLAWAILWQPTVSATAEAVPPPFRQ